MAPSALSHPASLPRISVITVIKNGVQFVGQTIESVLNQDYTDVEYIVIDGGSIDGTLDVIKAYEPRLTKWVSERDDGIADAFNKGVSLSTGDYVLFLNSDDALANTQVLEDMARMIVESGFPALIYGDYNILERDSGAFKYRGMVKLSPKGLVRGQVLPHPCLFAHRCYFDKYGGFDPQFRISMDYEWLLRGALKERIVHVPLLVSNIRGGGISTLDRGKVVDEIVSALKKNYFIRSGVGEYKVRGYFFLRFLARSILNVIGLYKPFFHLRNRLKNG